MKKEIRSDLTSKNKIADSINIVSKAVLAYEREPQKTEQQEDIKMKEVVVVSGVRLPVGSYGGSLKDITAIDMGAMVVKEAVKRAGIQPSDVDEVVIGQVGEVAENGFIARAVSLKAGMPKETTAYSVNRQCGSGLQSIAEAVMEIQTGQADVVVAGGTENISRLPYYVNDARWGARMGHKVFEDGVIDILTWPLDGNHNGVTAENVAEKYHVTREEQDAFAVRSHQRACKAIKEGKNILLEGQLGTLKDPDHGIYPMVTSSSTLAAYGAIGAGIPPYEIKKVVTVCKAYSSAVGAGAFVSEIFGDEAQELRVRGGDGGEFGATTGRPRRMGWFDCVASKYGCRLQGTTDVAFTVVDVLGYLDEIPVCTGYEIDGKVTTEFPVTNQLEKAKPVLEVLPGWKCDIRGIKKYEDLPENCRKYIEFVEEHIGYPITMVSNGPGRDDIIYRGFEK